METAAAGAGGAGKSIFHFPTCGHWLKVSCAADVLVVRASFARADGVFFLRWVQGAHPNRIGQHGDISTS